MWLGGQQHRQQACSATWPTGCRGLARRRRGRVEEDILAYARQHGRLLAHLCPFGEGRKALHPHGARHARETPPLRRRPFAEGGPHSGRGVLRKGHTSPLGLWAPLWLSRWLALLGGIGVPHRGGAFPGTALQPHWARCSCLASLAGARGRAPIGRCHSCLAGTLRYASRTACFHSCGRAADAANRRCSEAGSGGGTPGARPRNRWSSHPMSLRMVWPHAPPSGG